MQCTRPIRIGEYQQAPCGKCLACRIAHSREWATRIIHEASCYERSSFVTLTYNPENLPSNNGLQKAELVRFLKLLRYHLGERRIKYYACGEYGEQNDRPHYHGIFFGLGPKDKNLVDDVWEKGFTYFGTVTYDSARYVCDYIFKKHWDVWKETGREAPFQICSKGIGLKWCLDHKEQYEENLFVNVRGMKTGLPRYYEKKLDIDIEKKERQSFQNAQRKEERFKEVHGRTKEIDDYIQECHQAFLNGEARKALKGKRKI